MKEAIEKIINESEILNTVPTLLGTRILVSPIEKEINKGGIILPYNENQHWGVVVTKGEEVNPKIEIGSVVYWSGEVGEEFMVGDDELRLMDFRELKAIY